MNKIIIIIPYYGTWPSYLNLYFKSLEYNKCFDVIFVTDLVAPKFVPNNVFFKHLTFDDLKIKIRDIFKIDTNHLYPYKLCDFRPAYSLIFSDLIENYKFWGYGDIDLVFGDISKFFTSERLEKYDIFSFKKGHLHGPFTIYKNNQKLNYLFTNIENYIDIFSSPKYLSMDEFGKELFYTKISSGENLETFPNDNISIVALKEAKLNKIKIFNKQLVKEGLAGYEVLVFNNGEINQREKKYAFYHWYGTKQGIWFSYPKWFSDKIPNKFFFTSTGFYKDDFIKSFVFIHIFKLIDGSLKWILLKGSNYIKRRLNKTVYIDTYPKFGWIKKL